MTWTKTPCDLEARTQQGRPSGRLRTCRVHMRLLRLLWSDLNGRPWPEGMFACHHCDEPRCSNPRHIFPGTSSQNSKDAFAKGRSWGAVHGRGENHRFAKMTWEKVRDVRVRVANGETHRSVAASYEINESTVSLIVNQKRWQEDSRVDR